MVFSFSSSYTVVSFALIAKIGGLEKYDYRRKYKGVSTKCFVVLSIGLTTGPNPWVPIRTHLNFDGKNPF